MKNKIIKDALALTLITLVAGVALGGVYEITKDPIAKQEAQAKAEAYEQVFTDAAAFEAGRDGRYIDKDDPRSAGSGRV